jgi:hypothetical protein
LAVQTVWLQDIPIRDSPTEHDPKAQTDFPAVLQRVLTAVNVEPALSVFVKTVGGLTHVDLTGFWYSFIVSNFASSID